MKKNAKGIVLVIVSVTPQAQRILFFCRQVPPDFVRLKTKDICIKTLSISRDMCSTCVHGRYSLRSYVAVGFS